MVLKPGEDGVDTDADGVHIRGLLLCLFYKFAPSLLNSKRVKILKTPLIVAKKNSKIEKYFFNLTEYQEFSKINKGYVFEYKKGLGTWKADDLKYLFKTFGIENFIETLEYDVEAGATLVEWMSKETSEKRKEKLRGKSFDINGV